jgi:hypothetical protein
MASLSVSSVHGILAIASLRDQLSATGRRLSSRVAGLNLAIDVIPDHRDLLAAAEDVFAAADEESEVLSPEAAAAFWVPGVRWGRRMSEAVEQSIALARRLEHVEVGTSHLLLALLDNEDSAAYRLVASAGGMPLEIRSRVETSLSAS